MKRKNGYIKKGLQLLFAGWLMLVGNLAAKPCFAKEEAERGEGGAIAILADNGFNYARIRLLVDPPRRYGLHQDLDYVIETAVEAKRNGMGILLDLFYSDWWADPAHNNGPAIWADIGRIEELEAKVYEYTKAVFLALHEAGIQPGMVQVGNEVNPGMCLPLGRIEDGRWGNFVRLTNAGYRAVKEVQPACQVLIHYAGLGQGAMDWFSEYLKHGGKLDAFGVSFYEMWHGRIEDAAGTVEALHEVFGQPVYIVETAAYWKKSSGRYETHYPQNRKGQHRFLSDLSVAVKDLEGFGGLFYWGATWTQAERWLDAPDWNDDDAGCRGLFDGKGRATPAIRAWKEVGGLSIQGVDVSEALWAESKGVVYERLLGE